MPGPLFAVTVKKASKSKVAGILIALGHGIVEFPLMFLIYFALTEFQIPSYVQIAVGLIGGLLMIVMGVQTLRNRNKREEASIDIKRESVLAGVYTTAANAGFILWWLTIGTALILNAQLFGFIGFSIFAGVHWLCDLTWYAVAAFVIFSSQRFWNDKVRMGITFFCAAIFIGFGAFFMGTAVWSIIA